MKKLCDTKWMTPMYGIALLIVFVLGSVLLVSHPVAWEKIHRVAMKDKLKELHYDDANKITRGLWTDEPYQKISQSLKFRLKMNQKEIEHYEDVRSLLGKAKILVAVCAVIAVLGFVIVGWKVVWNAAFVSFILLGVIAGAWMWIDWHSLFKSLHWVVFWDDSWKLPDRSYSLGLFPHTVWKLAGGVIGGMVLIFLLIPMFIKRNSNA